EVHARRVETGPFEYMRIYWSYAEQDDGVRMTWIQDFHMKPTAPVDDDQMTQRLNHNSPIQMNVIKKKIEAAASRPADATCPGVLPAPRRTPDVPICPRGCGDDHQPQDGRLQRCCAEPAPRSRDPRAAWARHRGLHLGFHGRCRAGAWRVHRRALPPL